MNFTNDPIWYAAFAAAAFTFVGLFFPRMVMLRLCMLIAGVCAALVVFHFGSNIIATLLAGACVINAIRIFQIQNTSRRIRHIRHYGYNTADLAKYMKPVSFAAGEAIFSKGDPADRLYLITSGTIGIENGARVEKDGILGEVGLFTKAGKRSMGATAITDVEARMLNAEEASKLCMNEPEFAYALTQIMAARMTENMQRAG